MSQTTKKSILKDTHIRHLYQRAGFGISPKTVEKLSGLKKKEVVKKLFKSSKSITHLYLPTPDIDAFMQTDTPKKNPKKFRQLIKVSRSKLKDYNLVWVDKMATSNEELRERMTLFWANHFVVRTNNIVFSQHYNATLRKYALGNFRDFVIAIAKEPAMLSYLNNQQNRKGKPNENFARELMELFTLGIGAYTEKDIKESARAFTGWGHTFKGEFVLRKKQHDFGEKEFFGVKGNFNGEDIIDLILKRPECAQFIAKKIYLHFVNDIPNEGRIEELAIVFRENYNIEEVMRHLFMANWFYEKDVIGQKIKSPIDLLVQLKRTIPFSFKKPNEFLYIQRLLGQVLLEPPNVAGWSEGRNWIDSNTMMVRLKLPSVLFMNGTIAFDVKGEFEDSFEEFNKKKSNFNRRLTVTKNWEVFHENYGHLNYEELYHNLISTTTNKGTQEFLQSLKKTNKQEFCVQLMSLPEYQLC
ncbi:uncharacterized protein DUF1800 [Maribacter vaceletii]|uniref:Uncharacterized protein DUF1800 n=1 Tax=Maribacter vaceletii TaxID=1206816 RepID=A0A495DSC7_9FLAO|nr:uncharacterized protein DUF1800 [Maribacter vaceletii]